MATMVQGWDNLEREQTLGGLMCTIESLRNTTWNMDCLEFMQEIPDGSVDMICTDLPYQITNNHWDSLIPFDPLWKEYKRVIKNNGTIVLFGSQPFTSMLIISNMAMFKYCWVWDKANSTGFLNAKKQPLRQTEDICIFYGSQCTYNPQKVIRGKERIKGGYNKPGGSDNYGEFHDTKSTNNEYYPTNLLRISNADKTNRIHSTQKPVSLIEYLLFTYSNRNETVLDSCSGSATTAIACINTNRHYICIEKDKTYYDLGNKRISDHLAKLKQDKLLLFNQDDDTI